MDVNGIKDFDIEEVLECGQCFRFEKIGHKKYIIIAFNKELVIEQNSGTITFFDTTEEDFEKIWVPYFDLNRDYGEIKAILSSKDPILKEAVEFAGGIRILSQDPSETLISFIISQNNRIPMIKKVIKNISEKYGSKLNSHYSFPTMTQLQNAALGGLMECKTGFRAKYILDAANKNLDFEGLKKLSTVDLKHKLMEISGVGPKVSDCTMLFSFNRYEVFPTDVWIKRVMQYFYFDNKETSIKDIDEFAKQKFGNLTGFAQQYLFHFARIKKIGV
ncbi:MAG: 8-oxoguanine DNA glycosylase [Clostridiales bacterium]|jgi:N-glycosylase/DNA lyase|nr:8-oxoguanine DNA glycosylase [Clostridiales bacterium]